MNWQVSRTVTVSGIIAVATFVVAMAAAAAGLHSRLSIVETKQNSYEKNLATDMEDLKQDIRYIRNRIDGMEKK